MVTSPSPASVSAAPIVTYQGMRAGRLKITEFWDGRDVNGLYVPDGAYIYTLTAQSTATPEGAAGTPPFYASDHVEGTITTAPTSGWSRPSWPPVAAGWPAPSQS